MCLKGVCILLLFVLVATTNSIPDEKSTVSNTVEIAETDNSTYNQSVRTENPRNVETTTIVGNYTYLELSSDLVKQVENNLYNAVVSRKYDDAVTQTLRIYGKGYCNIIWNVVNRLIDNGIPEVFDYAYKVTAAKAWYICRSCFPTPIRMQENLVFVKIISYKYGMALRYSKHEDLDGDRNVYGDSNTKTRFAVTWKFVPYWYGDRVYFKVRPIDLAVFLKLGNSRDGDGDHEAFGSHNHDTNRHLWYVKPTRHNGKILFYIINREYDQPLKFGQSIIDGNRKAYGHSELDFNPDKFAWDLEVL